MYTNTKTQENRNRILWRKYVMYERVHGTTVKVQANGHLITSMERYNLIVNSMPQRVLIIFSHCWLAAYIIKYKQILISIWVAIIPDFFYCCCWCCWLLKIRNTLFSSLLFILRFVVHGKYVKGFRICYMKSVKWGTRVASFRINPRSLDINQNVIFGS